MTDALLLLNMAVGNPVPDLVCPVIHDTCGNGVIDDGEECDQGTLGVENCAALGKYDDYDDYGGLACGADCLLDTSGCSDVRYDAPPGSLTVTDLATGLMWQKTDDEGDLRDKDNTYTWNPAFSGTAPTGTAFSVFLAGLNGAVDGACFANHCDWRMPTVDELQTILLEPLGPPCGTDPCIDEEVFGPQNAGSFYWSSTTYAKDPTLAWFVSFTSGGYLGLNDKNLPFYVRAVRGGS